MQPSSLILSRRILACPANEFFPYAQDHRYITYRIVSSVYSGLRKLPCAETTRTLTLHGAPTALLGHEATGKLLLILQRNSSRR